MKNVLFATTLLLITIACQTKSNNEKLSETKSFAPNRDDIDSSSDGDYKVLAIPVDKNQFCVVKLGPKANDPVLELWTPNGSIDEKGLRQSLRYAGYGDHAVIGLLGAITAPIGGVGLIAAGGMTYNKGQGQSQESKTAMTATGTILGPMLIVGNWIPERMLRNNRVLSAKSKISVQRVPSTQLALWKERLEEVKPQTINGCKDYQPETSASSSTSKPAQGATFATPSPK